MENRGKSNFKVNEDQKQFELHVNGKVAFLEFYREGEKIFLTHTEVPESLRGTGIGGELVKHTLQCAKDNGFTVTPLCSFVAHYIDENPKWADILSDGYRM